MNHSNPYVKAIKRHVRQSLHTRTRPPTDKTGQRILVTTSGGIRRTVGWDYAYGPEENHAAAAFEVMRELGWDRHNDLVMGGAREGFVFVQVPKGCGVPARGISSGQTIAYGAE